MSKAKRAVLITVGIVAAIAACIALCVGMFLNSGKKGLLSGGVQDADAKVITYNGKQYRMKPHVASILVVGTDKEGGAEIGEGLNAQADAIMVVAVDTDSGKVRCIVIPRNAMVDLNLQIQGKYYGTDKLQICLAYALGGNDDESAELISTAVSRLFNNIPMNHVFAMNLSCIDDLADAVDGVEVEALEDIEFTNIKKGNTYTLYGKGKGETIHQEGEGWEWNHGTASWYVRYRDETVDSSPLDRQEREMQFVGAFFNKVVDLSKTNPALLGELYDIALASSHTDLDADEYAYLASILVGNPSGVEFVSLEGEMVYNDESEWGQFIVDKNSLNEIILNTYYEPVG